MQYLVPLALFASLASAVWQPNPGQAWQIVLNKKLTVGSAPVVPDVPIYDIDLFINEAATIRQLQAQGKKVICYFSAGTYEAWRPDASSFTKADLGARMEDWDENWLDIRSTNVRNIMAKRIALAKQKGCDGIDPDNMDGYGENGGGKNLKVADSRDYFRFLAAEARKHDLAIGLKNGMEFADDVVAEAQFAVNEQCAEYKECGDYTSFVNAKKPIFAIVYPTDGGSARGRTNSLFKSTCAQKGFSTVWKSYDLDGYVVQCDGSQANTK